MSYDPNAGAQNPWNQNPGDPNKSGNAQNQYGQDSFGQQGGDQYGQNSHGQQSGSGQSNQPADYGSYSASGDYPQNQAVYGNDANGYGQGGQQQSYGYGQDASQQSGGYGQADASQGNYGQSGAGGYAPAQGYGQDAGHNQGANYGQGAGYGQADAYGASAGGYQAGPSQPAKPKKGKGMLIGMIAGGIVVLLIAAGLIWEFAGRGSAGNTYVALLEEQGIQINGETAEGDLKGSFAGGSYVAESMGGEFSKVVVTGPELVANDIPYDVTYTLLGAPASGDGTINRVRVDVHVPADAIMDVFFDEAETADMEGMDVSLTSDGLNMKMEQYGSTMEMTIQISAKDGWMVMEVTSVTLDGEDYSSELGTDSTEQTDPCEPTGYESYVTDASVDEEGMHFQWEIDDVETNELALTTCME